jgi:hypothetical protein
MNLPQAPESLKTDAGRGDLGSFCHYFGGPRYHFLPVKNINRIPMSRYVKQEKHKSP